MTILATVFIVLVAIVIVGLVMFEVVVHIIGGAE